MRHAAPGAVEGVAGLVQVNEDHQRLTAATARWARCEAEAGVVTRPAAASPVACSAFLPQGNGIRVRGAGLRSPSRRCSCDGDSDFTHSACMSRATRRAHFILAFTTSDLLDAVLRQREGGLPGLGGSARFQPPAPDLRRPYAGLECQPAPEVGRGAVAAAAG